MLVGKERLKGVGICLALAVAVGAISSIGQDMVMTGLSNRAVYLHAEMQFRDFPLVTGDKAVIRPDAGVQKPCWQMMTG
jgi:hypothetical protein